MVRYNKVTCSGSHYTAIPISGIKYWCDGTDGQIIDRLPGKLGNILTGDGAAASRYIEARLSKFALEVIYSPKITDWECRMMEEELNLTIFR
jgi:hypothetical protein